MIASIRHKGLLRLFADGDRRGVPVGMAARLLRLLDRLDSSTTPEDMHLPGYKFHELKGARRGTYAVSASGNWRLTFRFDGGHAIDVDLEDYH